MLLGGNTLETGLDNSNTTFSGTISGSGGLVKSGPARLRWPAGNTYYRRHDPPGRQLTIGSDGNAGRPNFGTTNVAAGATLGLGVGLRSRTSTALRTLDALFAGTMANVSSDPNSNVGIDTTAGSFTYASNIPSTTLGLTKLGPQHLDPDRFQQLHRPDDGQRRHAVNWEMEPPTTTALPSPATSSTTPRWFTT